MVRSLDVRRAFLALVLAGSLHHASTYRTTGGVGSITELREYMETPGKSWTHVGEVLGRVFRGERDLTIAVSPAGAIPYYSRLRTVDMLGLNDAWVARHGIAIGEIPGHQRGAPLSYLLASGVHLVLRHPRVIPAGDPGPREFDARAVRSYLYEEIARDDLPAEARILELPLDDRHVLRLVYLRPHPAVERLLAEGGATAFPLQGSSAELPCRGPDQDTH